MIKKFVLLAVACACVGSYGVAGAQGTLDVKPDPAKPVVAEQAAPMVGMPSPIHEFATIDEAAKYMNITPQMPKLLPVGFNIQSVITLEKDILQVVYVYKSGAEPCYNQDGGAYIIYRSSKLTGDISGDHKIYKVIETERVDSMKVTFKGSDKMVYLASWIKDGQNHSLDFYRPVTRDEAKAIIRNIVEEKSHTK